MLRLFLLKQCNNLKLIDFEVARVNQCLSCLLIMSFVSKSLLGNWYGISIVELMAFIYEFVCCEAIKQCFPGGVCICNRLTVYCLN